MNSDDRRGRSICPVCGFSFPTGSALPYDNEGGASFNVCPCCLFHYGVTDGIEQETFETWRAKWVQGGPTWPTFPSDNSAPPDWDPDRQLRNIGLSLDAERARLAEEKARANHRTALEDAEKFHNLVLEEFDWLSECGFTLRKASRFRLIFATDERRVVVIKEIETGRLIVRVGRRDAGNVSLYNVLQVLRGPVLGHAESQAIVPRDEGELRRCLHQMSVDLAKIASMVFSGSGEWFESAMAIEDESN